MSKFPKTYENKNADKETMLKQKLEQYQVRFPDEYVMKSAIEAARTAMLESSSESQKNPAGTSRSLVNLLVSDASAVHPCFWLFSCICFTATSFLLMHLLSVEAAIGFTAPLPLLIGINDVFRSRDKGLFELEMACKFTGSELLLAKLFLIGLYNFLLIVLFCFGLTIFDFTSASWRLLFDGMASFLGLTGISLYFALRFRAAYVSFLMFLLWSFSILALEVLPFLKEAYLFVRTPFTFFSFIFGALLILFQMKKIYSHDLFTGRNESIEIGY